MRGPGDIVAIDFSVIRRVEPEENLRGFEPNYLPFIEFHDADFPWRYSLDQSTANARKDPWLTLITLKADEFELRDAGSAPLSNIIIRDASASLPKLEQSWAHAHVQVDLPASGNQDVAELLKTDSNLAFSRLFATRKLKENSAYFMFLVPSYAAGAQAGLGQQVDAPFGARAWDTSSTEAVTLPYYMQWRFSTDAAEDIELLMRRLRAFRADEADEAGEPKKVSAKQPGHYLDYVKPGAEFTLQSAMRQPGRNLEPYNTDPALAIRIIKTLTQVIAGQEVDTDDEDPLVAFPPYGHRYKPDTTASISGATNNKWFDRINLDLKFRHAAGLGAQVVQKNQELFAHICWTQYREITAANERLARFQTAIRLVASLNARRFSKLDSGVALTLAEPLHGIVQTSGKHTVSVTLQKNGAPLSFASRALRRQSAKRGRSVGRLANPGFIPSPMIPGDRASRQTGSIASHRFAGDLRKESGLSDVVAAEFAELFDAGAFDNQVRPKSNVVRVSRFDSGDLVAPTTELLNKLPSVKARVTIQGLKPSEASAISPIWRAPQVPLPLSSFLPDISRDAILSDAEKMPDNTIALFLENRKFIEAFLVGANHEMNNELRWREFPTDLRGTVFKRFWDRHLPKNNVAGDDIAQIHSWRGNLGSHFPPADGDNKANVIAVIRGDIVRKLGDPIMAINIANGNDWVFGQGEDHTPIFSGRLGRDLAYFGFDITRTTLLSSQVKNRAFFVIYEAPGRLRFGMDVATAAVRVARTDFAARRYAIPMQHLNTVFRQAPPQVLSPPEPPPPTPATPSDLSWSHAHLTISGHIDFSENITITNFPELWNDSKTSASLARAMWQMPVAGVLPLKRVL